MPSIAINFLGIRHEIVVGSVGFEPIMLVGSVVVSFKDFGRVGPKGVWFPHVKGFNAR